MLETIERQIIKSYIMYFCTYNMGVSVFLRNRERVVTAPVDPYCVLYLYIILAYRLGRYIPELKS